MSKGGWWDGQTRFRNGSWNNPAAVRQPVEVLLSLPLSFVPRQGKNPEDVVRRYTEKIKVLPDEVGKSGVNTPQHTHASPMPTVMPPFDVQTERESCGEHTVVWNGSRWSISLGYSRTAPSAWRGWPWRRDTKASCSTKASSQSWWANLASAATCTICCAWWPCTTMAIRWVKAAKPDAAVMSLAAQMTNLATSCSLTEFQGAGGGPGSAFCCTQMAIGYIGSL